MASPIGVICGEEKLVAILPLPRQRVVWYSLYSMETNNNQGDEPHTTTLERQVQTLAAAVECVTKQNHDLEEQLRQRNTGPNHHQKE